MLCIYHWNFGFCINTYQALSIVCSRVLWAGILHLAQPLSWADTLSGFFELSWAEPAQGVLSQIELASAGSTQLKDWASLSWEDLELSNWARLSWSCFSLSQLELDRYFMNFGGKNQIFWLKMSFFDQKCHFFPLFLGIQLEPGWASSTWLKLTQPSSIVEPAWAELNLQLNALSQLELSLIWKFMIEPAWAEFQAQLTALSFPAQAGSSWLRLAQSCWAGSKNPSRDHQNIHFFFRHLDLKGWRWIQFI